MRPPVSTKQHTVPRLLQKGFTFPEAVKRTWWVTKAECVERNIRGLWADRGAYSTSEDADADGAITKTEGEEFAATVEMLRNHKLPAREQIGRLIAHLEVRQTRRSEEAQELTRRTGEVVFSRMTTPKALEEWSKTYTPPGTSVEDIGGEVRDEALARRIANNNTANRVESVAVSVVRTVLELHKFLISDGYTRDQLSAGGRSLRWHERHVAAKILAQEPVPLAKADQYADFKWGVRQAKGLVLGDTMVFYWRKEQQRYASILGNSAGLKGIYLPVAHDTVLIGKKRKLDPELNWRQIQEGSAMTTREGFICRELTANCNRLRQQIGIMRHELSREDWWAIAEMVCERLGIDYGPEREFA